MKSSLQIAVALGWALALGASAAFAGSSSSVGTGFGNTKVEDATNGVKVAISGEAAQAIYDSLSAAREYGPYATGACLPNTPCDPPTFWGRSGPGISCAKTVFSSSGRIEYSCDLNVATDGTVTGS